MHRAYARKNKQHAVAQDLRGKEAKMQELISLGNTETDVVLPESGGVPAAVRGAQEPWIGEPGAPRTTRREQLPAIHALPSVGAPW